MGMWAKARFGITGALLAAILAAADPTGEAMAGEAVVLGSTASAWPSGALIASGQTVTLAAGESLQAVAADGSVIMLQGPFAGPVGAPDGGDPGLLRTLQAVASRERISGAFAAGRGDGAAGGRGFDLVGGGELCLGAGGPPPMALPTRRFDRIVALVPAGGRPVETLWPANAATAPWPTDLRLAPGARLRVLVDGAEVGAFAVRAAPAPAANPALGAAALEAAGCHAQAGAALAAMGR